MSQDLIPLAAVRSIARSYIEPTTSPAHDWHHVQRVETLADRLIESAPPAIDARTVRLAVILHDIGRPREEAGEIDDHADWGAREARSLLEDRGEPPGRIEDVCHAIRAHRYSRSPDPANREAKISADADNLDALGAVGIARSFAYGGELGQPIHDPAWPPATDETAAGQTQYNHIHKKLLDLPDRMYTEAGRRIAIERRAYVEDFLARFDREVAGED